MLPRLFNSQFYWSSLSMRLGEPGSFQSLQGTIGTATMPIFCSCLKVSITDSYAVALRVKRIEITVSGGVGTR
jgi:hypothetical protein